MSRDRTTIFVGLGSPHGDDAVGWRIAERILAADFPDVAVRLAATPLDVLDWLVDRDRLVVCDACDASEVTGTVYNWRWPSVPMEPRSRGNSHAVSLIDVLRLAERLGQLPAEVQIYAIVGQHFQPAEALSSALERAMPGIVDRLMGDLFRARALTGTRIA